MRHYLHQPGSHLLNDIRLRDCYVSMKDIQILGGVL